MLKREKDGTQWLEFELFQQFRDLKHAIFLRHGGYSEGPYCSLNLGFAVGDDTKVVLRNMAKAKSCLDIEHLASSQQVHSDSILAIGQENWQKLQPADALMTNVPGIGLKITHADCQAAIFYDPVKHVVAAVHAGWRGQVLNIYAKTIQALQTKYGCQAADIFVGIGPSLGPQHAEFKNYQAEFPAAFWEFECQKNHFDLWAIAAFQLRSAGVLPGHMQQAYLCTYENARDYFSYRRSQHMTGRHATMAALRAF